MQKNLAPLWKNIAEVIGAQVSRDTFQRWFQAVELLEANETDLTLGVPNNIYQLWIEMNYMALVHSAIESVLGAPRAVRFSVDHDSQHLDEEKNAREPRAQREPSDAQFSRENETASAAEHADIFSKNGNENSGKENGNGDGKKENAHDAARKTPAASASSNHAAANSANNNSGMLPRNTFDTFVVGKNSEFACAAAKAVAKEPATKYNPLFLHGGVGLGKTHLMHAIGQAVAERSKPGKVLYVSCEHFTNEFIDAIQNNALVKFRKRYRQLDVLLIDDIQFLARKGQTQEEFFHTFNTLFDGRKQIVLSSDRPPCEIADLEARLVSRFEWGLTAHIEPPDAETRIAILRKKAATLGIRVDNAIIEFLAQRIRTNVRRLEGALMRVASFASLNRDNNQPPPTIEEIENLLKDMLHEEARQEARRNVTIDQIQKKVAEHYDVRLADMTSKRRPQNIAFPRQIAMYLARELTKASLNEIGEAFGGRDHGTVLHAHRLVQERMQKEEKVRRTVAALDSELGR